MDYLRLWCSAGMCPLPNNSPPLPVLLQGKCWSISALFLRNWLRSHPIEDFLPFDFKLLLCDQPFFKHDFEFAELFQGVRVGQGL
jgi:hypothetical protein